MHLHTYIKPTREEQISLCKRPASSVHDIGERVSEILQSVQQKGDEAIRELTFALDGIKLDTFKVQEAEFLEAHKLVSTELMQALQTAAANITLFHQAQYQPIQKIETTPGIYCWRKSVPIQSVGLYIPGGSAPLFSTVLMLAIPAKLAGCEQIIVCTPPNKAGKVHPAILVAAQLAGVTAVYKVGGAQAIGALTFGTSQIPAVSKIFGPGNAFVTVAKQLATNYGVAIDMPAGPSEVLVIADETANADYVAADLLAQAEHGPDSQVVLVTTSLSLVTQVEVAIDKHLQVLPRSSIANKALANSFTLVVDTLEQALDFSNVYAPEHLILSVQNPEKWVDKVQTAGSVFLGHYTPESLGDYASGTNHTLPTSGFARAYSGVSLDSFVKKITFQQATPEGLQALSNTVITMAQAEQLDAHALAVQVRL